MEQSLPSRIVNAVLEDLADRRGFKAVLSDIDPDVAVELQATLAEKVSAVLGAQPEGKAEEPKLTALEVNLRCVKSLLAIAEKAPNHGDRIEAAKVLLGRG